VLASVTSVMRGTDAGFALLRAGSRRAS